MYSSNSILDFFDSTNFEVLVAQYFTGINLFNGKIKNNISVHFTSEQWNSAEVSEISTLASLHPGLKMKLIFPQTFKF